MRKILLIVGIVILAAAAAAGGFYGGVQYQSNIVDQAQANFERARGEFPTGQALGGMGDFPGGAGSTGGQAFGLRGGISGQIKSIDGNTLTISTAEDVTTVNLSEATRIQETRVVELSLSDLQPGVRVMVTGEKDENGVVSATQIMILANNLPGGSPYPAPGGTEP
jgi:hypothetical protein